MDGVADIWLVCIFSYKNACVFEQTHFDHSYKISSIMQLIEQ